MLVHLLVFIYSEMAFLSVLNTLLLAFDTLSALISTVQSNSWARQATWPVVTHNNIIISSSRLMASYFSVNFILVFCGKSPCIIQP